MDRLTFLRVLGITPLLSSFRSRDRIGELSFVAGDQADDRVKIFTDTSPNTPFWEFKLGYRPTDIKRFDWKNHQRVLVSCHGAIFDVPIEDTFAVISADSLSGCHSVERLPDGCYISACSNENVLRLHFRPKKEADQIRLEGFEDYSFNSAHGIVYDKERKCLWAIGQHLARFAYLKGNKPSLRLLEEFPLPYENTGGHDLFPNSRGNLLISTHEAVYELTVGQFDKAKRLIEMPNVKSVVSDNNTGETYITEPLSAAHYESWQTNQILNLNTKKRIKVDNAKFYKVRLWQKNSFSY